MKTKEEISKQNKQSQIKRISKGLTDQDNKIISFIFNEKSSAEIAKELGKSIRTIENSRLAITKIIGCKNSIGIVKYALKKGMVSLKK